jgi:hypothetical protein
MKIKINIKLTNFTKKLKIFDFSKFPKTVFLVKCYENLINSLNLGLVRRFVEKLTNYYFVLNLGYSDDRSRT